MFTVSQIQKVLLKDNILSAKNIAKHLKASEIKQENFLNYLIEEKIVEEEMTYQLLAQSVKKPYIKFKDQAMRQDILFLIPELIAKTHDIIAYDKNEQVLKIASTDPDDIQTFEFIEKKTGLKVDVSIASPSSIKQALRLYHQSLEMELKDISQDTSSDLSQSGDEALKKLATDLPVVRLVDSLLEYAIFEGASDIHIEPQEKEIVVRYRVDGILRQVMTFPKSALSGIVARIKILSNLKLDEHRMPQDGRFKTEEENYKISFRVSTIPVFDGEKIVMRLLDESSQLLHLDQLGFRENDLNKINIAIKKPYGMILITGPTGSGKSTTLYSILNTLNTAEVNITTIEDPIEYRMQNINQSQVNPKMHFTFATGLRALLRQDPDIIMVGEIRDQETAEIAIHSAMTGHKVLSTLHTNDAPGALPRLLDMGLVPFLITSTIHLVVAQRLVRKICQHCIMSYNLDKKAISDLSDQLNLNLFFQALKRERMVSSKEKNLGQLLFFKGKGCKKCGSTGYKGRIGIYEILEVSDSIQKMIIDRKNASEIRKTARAQGMDIMLEDGLVKAKKGITTIEEVLRVTKE